MHEHAITCCGRIDLKRVHCNSNNYRVNSSLIFISDVNKMKSFISARRQQQQRPPQKHSHIVKPTSREEQVDRDRTMRRVPTKRL
jgi:hypothetical protein